MPMLCTSTFFRNKSISLGVKSKHSGFRLPSVCVCVYIYIYIYIYLPRVFKFDWYFLVYPTETFWVHISPSHCFN